MEEKSDRDLNKEMKPKLDKEQEKKERLGQQKSPEEKHLGAVEKGTEGQGHLHGPNCGCGS